MYSISRYQYKTIYIVQIIYHTKINKKLLNMFFNLTLVKRIMGRHILDPYRAPKKRENKKIKKMKYSITFLSDGESVSSLSQKFATILENVVFEIYLI